MITSEEGGQSSMGSKCSQKDARQKESTWNKSILLLYYEKPYRSLEKPACGNCLELKLEETKERPYINISGCYY